MQQKVSFRNARGLRLAGILNVPGRPATKAIVIAHGFTSNKDGSHRKFVKVADTLEKSGFAVLRFDFSGCGESQPDTITVAKQVNDLKAAISFMRRKGYPEISLIGSSLGGLDCLLAYDEAITTMVLWAPVTKARTPHSLQNPQALQDFREKGFTIIRNRKGIHRVGKDFLKERTSLDRKEVLSRIECPVLIIHGDADDILPLEDSSEALELLQKGAKLEVIHGANHHFTGKVDALIELTVEWLGKFL